MSRIALLSSEQAERLFAAQERKYRKLAEEYLAIEREDAASGNNVGFVAKWLVHASLPYREPKDSPPAWGRRSGDLTLVIQPGYYQRQVWVTDKRGRDVLTTEMTSLGYPFGSYPRLVLAWIATEVVRNRSRELILGESLADFMASIGKPEMHGGPRGNIATLKSQMLRLFSANIAVTTDPEAVVWQNDGFRIADSSNIEFLWDPAQTRQRSLWKSSLKLSERFFESLITNPVPVDLRIVKGLAASPISIDIYCWLTYRNAFQMRTVKVSWELLQAQFGSESSKWKFKENFLRALKSVIVLYPAAKVSYDSAGLIMAPSPPSVPKLYDAKGAQLNQKSLKLITGGSS